MEQSSNTNNLVIIKELNNNDSYMLIGIFGSKKELYCKIAKRESNDMYRKMHVGIEIENELNRARQHIYYYNKWTKNSWFINYFTHAYCIWLLFGEYGR